MLIIQSGTFRPPSALTDFKLTVGRIEVILMTKLSNHDRDLSHEKGDFREHGDWDRLLTEAGPRDHVVQLYQDQDFLNRAVCRFAAAALANGEGVILVPTVRHWNAFRPRLIAEGVEVEAAQKRGQLTIVDADETLPRFMHEGMPDSPVFLGLAADVVTRARAGNRFPKVRWWGEMVNILWERGDVAASMNLEDYSISSPRSMTSRFFAHS